MARMARLDVRFRTEILFRIDGGRSLVFEKASNGVQMRAPRIWLPLLFNVFLDGSVSGLLGAPPAVARPSSACLMASRMNSLSCSEVSFLAVSCPSPLTRVLHEQAGP